MSDAGTQSWARVKVVLAGALERPATERTAFLDGACGGDAALRKEVESLLAAHAAAEASAFIESPAVPDASPDGLEGHMVGPYRVLAEVGRGGMGAVYRAVRADDEYQKQVALKVVGRPDPELVRRFRSERQILASLDHPGIARLIDGGATADGLPWLAMEFVCGQPITEYVRTHGLTLRQRLELFRETCAAVHYAHQSLVVHRDLKPSNILVTPAGAPRLLDFGIAKLLSDDDLAAGATLTLLRAMTPEYASPEQVRGQPITTASDVYSLGVLLCEILTGRRPHDLATRDPAEVAHIITSIAPAAPSALARAETSAIRPRELQGDLDTIVRMALRKEPERRYRSVDQLSEDVRRHLERRPVIARPDTVRYRTARFVRRNQALVGTAAVLGLSVVVALGAALVQAREARRERAVAERRFEDVRQLAHSFLFEFYDTIQDLPGSTPARQLLVTRGLSYLDRLSREGASAALQREVATAYLRVGDVQGRPNMANLGDTSGALASYGKAVATLRALDAAHPGDPAVRRDLAVALHRTGVLEASLHHVPLAVATEREAIAIAESVLAAAPDDLDALRVLLYADTRLADILAEAGRLEESLAAARSALPRYEALFARTGNKRDRLNVAIAHTKVGRSLAGLEKYPEAVVEFEKAEAIMRSMAEGQHDATAQRALAVVLNYRGDVHEAAGDHGRALPCFREALGIREALAPADPRNVLARADLVGSYVRIGDALLRDHDDTGAAREYGRAFALAAAIEEAKKGDVDAAADRGGVEARLAEVDARQGRPQAALQRYEGIIPRLEAVLRVSAEDADDRYDLAAALAGRARAERQLATARRSTGDWQRARASYARSLELWRSLVTHRAGDSRLEAGPPPANLRAAEDGLAACDEALRRLAAP